METNTLNQESEKIVEEMVKTWEESLELSKNLVDDTKLFSDLLDNFARQVIYEISRDAADRLMKAVEKYVAANKLTRWYWKRRFLNEKKKFDEVMASSMELARSLKEDDVWKEQ